MGWITSDKMIGSPAEFLRICDCLYTGKNNTQHHLQIKPTARIALLKIGCCNILLLSFMICELYFFLKQIIQALHIENYVSLVVCSLKKIRIWGICFECNPHYTVCWQLSCTVFMFSSRINQPYTVLYASMAVENIQLIPCKFGLFWDIQLLFLQQDLYFHLCT